MKTRTCEPQLGFPSMSWRGLVGVATAKRELLRLAVGRYSLMSWPAAMDQFSIVFDSEIARCFLVGKATEGIDDTPCPGRSCIAHLSSARSNDSKKVKLVCSFLVGRNRFGACPS